MSVNADVLTVENLSFSYGSTAVLSDLSFSLKSGDYVALVGPNGSGKTTLIKLILGLSESYDGAIKILGRDRGAFSDWNRVGYLPQKVSQANQHFPATVREVAAMGLLANKKFPKRLAAADYEAVDHSLALMDVEDLKKKMFVDLSVGQQQRVLVARAIVNRPELLILDEPTSALDPENRERFFALMKDMNKRGVTIIIVTHDVGNMGIYSSKLLYIDKKLVFYGSFDEFCRSDDVTRTFGEYAQHIICHRHDHS